MTNFEKLKTMNEQDFACAVAAVTTAFRKRTKIFLEDAPDTLWGLMFVHWLTDFVGSQYDGAFDSPDEKELDEMLKNMMRGDRQGNPFEGGCRECGR